MTPEEVRLVIIVSVASGIGSSIGFIIGEAVLIGFLRGFIKKQFDRVLNGMAVLKFKNKKGANNG